MLSHAVLGHQHLYTCVSMENVITVNHILTFSVTILLEMVECFPLKFVGKRWNVIDPILYWPCLGDC